MKAQDKKPDKLLRIDKAGERIGVSEKTVTRLIATGQITACRLMSESGVRISLIIEALRNLVEEISDAFCAIQEEFGKGSKT